MTNVQDILDAIDGQISKLQEARAVLSPLASIDSPPAVSPKSAKPPKGKKASKSVVKAAGTPPKKRTMSPEARKRIGDAVKKRWAAKKKAAKAA